MAATFGAGTLTAPVAVGTDGLLRSVTSKNSVETYPYRNANGVTEVLLPGKLRTNETTVEFYGAAALASVAGGAFTQGTLKLVSAKTSESNEGVPEGSHTYKSFTDIA